MFSASIKLANLQYLDALQQLALSNMDHLNHKPKLLKMPFYNFVCTMTEIMYEFAKTSLSAQILQNSQNQSDFYHTNINSFIVDYYVHIYNKKYSPKGHSQVYRQLFSMLRSWKKFTEHHQQAKLFLSILTPSRNGKQPIKLFLKFRKCILKTLNHKIMQQISITHQDALTMTHTLFSGNINSQLKSYVVKKINEIFISLKRKFINSAKVNGAVMCQFFLCCCERFQQMDTSNLFKNSNTHNNNNNVNQQYGQNRKKSLITFQAHNSVSPKTRIKSGFTNNVDDNLITADKFRLTVNNDSKRNNSNNRSIEYLQPQHNNETTNKPYIAISGDNTNNDNRLFINPLQKQKYYPNDHTIQNNQNNNQSDINKYNLSFSQEFASCYSQQQQQQYLQEHPQYQRSSYCEDPSSTLQLRQSNRQAPKLPIKKDSHSADKVKKSASNQQQHQTGYNYNHQNINNYYSTVKSSNTSGWKINNSENQQPINQVRDSLLFLKEKDRQIDQRLSMFRKSHLSYNSKTKANNESSLMQGWSRNQQDSLLNSGYNAKSKLHKYNNQQNDEESMYPEGWQEFIETNQKTKEKLMGSKFTTYQKNQTNSNNNNINNKPTQTSRAHRRQIYF